MKSYECTIFMGSIRQGSDGAHFTESDVIGQIKYFQSMHLDPKITVRITNTRYVFMHYTELGFEISAIQYPRYQYTEFEIREWMVKLAKYLKVFFQQRSLSVMDKHHVLYLGDEDEHSV